MIGKHLHLTETLCNALKLRAKEERRSQSSLAEELIRQGLESREMTLKSRALIRAAQK